MAFVKMVWIQPIFVNADPDFVSTRKVGSVCVQFGREVIETETVVMRSTSGTIRWIRAEHRQLGKFR
jgi:hypothetical protein